MDWSKRSSRRACEAALAGVTVLLVTGSAAGTPLTAALDAVARTIASDYGLTIPQGLDEDGIRVDVFDGATTVAVAGATGVQEVDATWGLAEVTDTTFQPSASVPKPALGILLGLALIVLVRARRLLGQ